MDIVSYYSSVFCSISRSPSLVAPCTQSAQTQPKWHPLLPCLERQLVKIESQEGEAVEPMRAHIVRRHPRRRLIMRIGRRQQPIRDRRGHAPQGQLPRAATQVPGFAEQQPVQVAYSRVAPV